MTRATPHLLRLLALLALLLALVACGGDEEESEPLDPGTTAGSTADPPATDADTEPSATEEEAITTLVATLADLDADTVVLRLASGGGFVPMEVAMAEVPTLVVMGDGRVYRVADPDALELVMRRIEELRLTPEGLAALLAAAGEAGLLDGTAQDYGDPPVTDLPTTTLTIHADGGPVTHSAYALGFESEPGDGLTAEQRERRRALGAFVERLANLESLVGEHLEPVGPYVPERLVLQRFPTPEGASAQRVPWPSEDVPPPPEGCSEVTGAEARAAAGALASAGPDTSWTLSGVEFRVVGRAVLPGEDGCPA